MSAARKASLVVPAAARHTATVIFAHGLGDTGHGWGPVVENWRRRQRLDHVKFILPHALTKPITAVSCDPEACCAARPCAGSQACLESAAEQRED